MNLQEKIKQIPHSSGVYIFKNDDKIIYVGKAHNLFLRIKSYFYRTSKTFNITDIEYIITSSEREALILEDKLIKKYKPRYNIKLRDDKHYPFLRISCETYPRISLVRKKNNDQAKYFGPYTNTKILQKTIDVLRKLFGIRICKKNIDKKTKVCLNFYIKRCSGPCENYITKEEYNKNVEKAIFFLNQLNK